MTFEEFEKTYLVDVLNNKPSFIRNGQALMVYLCEVRFDLYTEITAMDNDCFYNDRIIPSTLKHLKENW